MAGPVELEFAILQCARLKGRLGPDTAVGATGVSEDVVLAEFARLGSHGLLKGEGTVRLTPEGRERLAELVAGERVGVDGSALGEMYDEFHSHNTSLKELMKDWQLRDGEPNDHTHAAYDATVLEQLHGLHQSFAPLAQRITALVPRLSYYLVRFDRALVQVRAGDTSFVARPIADSYHTVWFEFHEELIGLLGLSREEEAVAGRAL